MKNTHGELLLLVKLQANTPRVFFTFLSCTTGIKSRKASYFINVNRKSVQFWSWSNLIASRVCNRNLSEKTESEGKKFDQADHGCLVSHKWYMPSCYGTKSNNNLWLLHIFTKKLNHRCLIFFEIRRYYNCKKDDIKRKCTEILCIAFDSISRFLLDLL